jgi:hypothetical protein
MGTGVRDFLDAFDRLDLDERRAIGVEILRRTAGEALPPLEDEDLTPTAEELFLALDEREAAEAGSTAAR